jgi:hypothetical protein
MHVSWHLGQTVSRRFLDPNKLRYSLAGLERIPLGALSRLGSKVPSRESYPGRLSTIQETKTRAPKRPRWMLNI